MLPFFFFKSKKKIELKEQQQMNITYIHLHAHAIIEPINMHILLAPNGEEQEIVVT